jgi:hypothetical protein
MDVQVVLRNDQCVSSSMERICNANDVAAPNYVKRGGV